MAPTALRRRARSRFTANATGVPPAAA